jgi:hypothetical protein
MSGGFGGGRNRGTWWGWRVEGCLVERIWELEGFRDWIVEYYLWLDVFDCVIVHKWRKVMHAGRKLNGGVCKDAHCATGN